MSSQGLSPSEAYAERRRRIKIEFPTTGLCFVRTEVYYPLSQRYHKAEEMVTDFDENSASMLNAKQSSL